MPSLTPLAASLFSRYAGHHYTHTKTRRKLRVLGVQSEPHIRVLVKSRRNQLMPDEMAPSAWLEWVKEAKETH